jgi:uncharacterized protein YlxW (UPF0749 family)
MNLLGKISVVLILVASLVFMTLAMAVYATHKNWYVAVREPGGLQEQLDQAQAENRQLKDRYDRLQSDLVAERAQLTQQLAKAETERAGLEQTNRQIDEQLGTLQTQLRTANAAVSATQEQNQRLNQQRDQLLAEVRDEQSTRDRYFQMAKNATETLQQRLAQLTKLEEYIDSLEPQVAQYRNALSSYGFNPDVLPDYVPNVDGVIRTVRQEGAQRYIEVSIGSDDGLQRGHELIIYRDGRFLAKAKVTQTDPDISSAVVIPQSVEGAIREGDRVATRIRLG